MLRFGNGDFALHFLAQAGKLVLGRTDFGFQTLDGAGQCVSLCRNLTLCCRNRNVAICIDAAQLGLIVRAEHFGALDDAVIVLDALKLAVLVAKLVRIPLAVIVVRRDDACDVLDKRLLVTDVAVDILTALKIDAIFCLDIGQHLKNVLGIVDALRNLAKLFTNPVCVPVKFDQRQNDAVLFLPA